MAGDRQLKVLKQNKNRKLYLSGKALEGTLDVMPNPEYRARDIYRIEGVGSIFSGNYYVTRAVHTISDSGYSVSLDVVGLDHVFTSTSIPSESGRPAQSQSKPNSNGSKTYKVVSGDTLGGIAKRFNTSWQKIFEINRDVIKDPNQIYPNQIIKLP